MKNYIFILLLLTCSNTLVAQSFKEVKTFQGVANSTIETLDGGLLRVFTFNDSMVLQNNTVLHSYNGKPAVAMIKKDSSGNIQWFRHFVTQWGVGVDAVTELPNGDYLIGINYFDTLYVDSLTFVSQGEKDVIILKLDPNGQVLKHKSISGTYKILIRPTSFHYFKGQDSIPSIYFGMEYYKDALNDTISLGDSLILNDKLNIQVAIIELDSNLSTRAIININGNLKTYMSALDLNSIKTFSAIIHSNSDTFYFADTIIATNNLSSLFGTQMIVDSAGNYLHHNDVFIDPNYWGPAELTSTHSRGDWHYLTGWTKVEAFTIGGIYAPNWDWDEDNGFLYGYNQRTKQEWLLRNIGRFYVEDVTTDTSGHVYACGTAGAYLRFRTDTIFGTQAYQAALLIADTTGTLLHFQYLMGTGFEQAKYIDRLEDGTLVIGGQYGGGDVYWEDSLVAQTPSDHEEYLLYLDPTLRNDTIDTTGLHNYDMHSWSLYPNPSHGDAYIHITDGQTKHIQVYSLTGELIYHAISRLERVTLPSEEWRPGSYLVHVRDSKSGEIQLTKFIKI